MKIEKKYPHQSRPTLARQVKTAHEVIARHPTIDPIAAFGTKLGEKGERFLIDQRGLETLKVTRAAALERSARARAELVEVTSAWIGPLSTDIEGFQGASFLRNPQVTLDVLEDAQRVVGVVQSQVPALPYGETLLSQLGAAITHGSEAHKAERDAAVAVQQAQSALRTLALELNKLLVGLRHAVRATLGRSHVDYQRLRVDRGSTTDESPDPPATEPAPSASEAEGASRPSSVG